MEWKNIIREIEDHSTMQLFCLHGSDLPSLSELRALLENSRESRIAGAPFRSHEVTLLTSRAQYIRKHHHEGLFFQQRYQASYKDQGETVRQRLEKQIDSGSVPVLLPWIEAFELEEIFDKPLIQLSSGEWQRFSVCEALLMKPRILLVPDLLKGLDQRWQQRIFDLLVDRMVAGGRVIFTADIPPDHSAVHNLAVTTGPPLEESHFMTDLPAKVVEDFTSYQTQFLTAPTGETLLEMDGVYIRYGSKTILQDIHWTIRSGDKWNLQGANGAGKSTLISLVNSDNPQGYSQPINMFGMPYGRTSMWERKARIAYFGSDFFQYFQSSKNIEQVLLQQLKTPYLDTVQPPETLIRELMHWFGLWAFRETPYQTTSPEIRRQTLLLATYLKSSDILVLDEPYQEMISERIQLNNHFLESTQLQSPQTVLFVTHKNENKPRFLDKILRLENGKVAHSS